MTYNYTNKQSEDHLSWLHLQWVNLHPLAVSFYISLTERAKRDYFSISFFPFPVYLGCPYHKACEALTFFKWINKLCSCVFVKILTGKRNCNFHPMNNPVYFNVNISVNKCLKNSSLKGTESTSTPKGYKMLTTIILFKGNKITLSFRPKYRSFQVTFTNDPWWYKLNQLHLLFVYKS